MWILPVLSRNLLYLHWRYTWCMVYPLLFWVSSIQNAIISSWFWLWAKPNGYWWCLLTIRWYHGNHHRLTSRLRILQWPTASHNTRCVCLCVSCELIDYSADQWINRWLMNFDNWELTNYLIIDDWQWWCLMMKYMVILFNCLIHLDSIWLIKLNDWGV